MRHYLGIDIGTFESKGVLADEQGRIVATAAHPHKMLVPQAGFAEHRPEEDWWHDFRSIARSLLEQARISPHAIRAIAVSAIGPCMLPVDEQGVPLMNAVLYGVDTRAAREIEDLNAEIGAEAILGHCGNALTSQSVGPKILWLKRHRPEIFRKAHRIITSTSYLVHKLTGRFVIDHYTAANAAPLYSAKYRLFDDGLTRNIIDIERLPEILWSSEIAGMVTKSAAAETGLAEGTPVTCGTVDAAAEALSVGVSSPGDLMLMYGSTMFMIAPTAERLVDARLWYAPWLFPGEHAAMAGLATSGTLTHWFRDQLARELDPSEAMRQLAEEAAGSPPGAKGLVLLPYFSGERTPIHDPSAKGLVFGLDLTHSRADLYRALLEGIGHGTRHVLETYAEAGCPIDRIFAVGGGTRNAVWSGGISDICGKPQILREKTIGASYGNAFLAALAVGDVTRSDIARWNPVTREIEPDLSNRPVHDRHFDIFKQLYSRNRDLMARLAREHQP